MKMDKVAGSQNDEFYTPRYAVLPILKYIKPQSVVWCPFDTDESNFVKVLREAGHRVIATHLFTGTDFFSWEPDEPYDYIVSNPPYTLKYEVLNRLFLLEKKFAMLVGVVGLFESQKRFSLFQQADFQIMYLSKRISFFKDFKEQKPSLNPPFSSAYVAHGMFPKQIIFEEVDKQPS